jgi:WD40 repeat protein
VVICAALAWFIPGSPLPGLLGARATQAPTSPSPAPTTAAANPTSVAAPTSAPLPTVAPATLGPRAITLQNASQITQTREITGPVLGPVSFSPDGKTVAVGISNIVHLLDGATLDSFEPPRQLAGHPGEIFALAWSPDGKLLASGAHEDRNIRLWEPETGKLVRTLVGQDGWTRSLAFSPDGKILAAGSTDKAIWLWNVDSGDVLETLVGHTDWVGGVAFSPDGKSLASASRDGTVRLWDIATGKQHDDFKFQVAINPTTGTPYWTNGLAFSPDGKVLAVGSTDKIIHLVDPTTGEERHKLEGHTNWIIIRGVVFAPDGKTLATAGFDGTIRRWDPTTGKEIGKLEGHRFQIAAISFSPDSQRIISSSDQEGLLLLWDVQTQQAKPSLRIGQGLITTLTFSQDGALLGVVGYNGTIRVHLIDQGRARTFFGSTLASQPMAFLPDGRIVAISDEETIGIVAPDAVQGQRLNGLDGSPFNVTTSQDGTLIAAGSSTGAIELWDSATGAAKSGLKTDLKTIYALAISPDGKLIAAAGPPTDPRVQIWDIATGKLRWTLPGTNAAIGSLVFQPQGNLLAASDFDGKLRLWNIEDGTLVRTIAANDDRHWFSSIAFSPDGKMLITGSANGELVFWEVATGDEAATLSLSVDAIFSLAVSPDGQRIAVGLGDESVRIYELATK